SRRCQSLTLKGSVKTARDIGRDDDTSVEIGVTRNVKPRAAAMRPISRRGRRDQGRRIEAVLEPVADARLRIDPRADAEWSAARAGHRGASLPRTLPGTKRWRRSSGAGSRAR